MKDSGEESVMYYVFHLLPLAKITIPIIILIIFLSYVTAADSNISAMSSMATKGITSENPEAPKWIKILLGLSIGLLSIVMVTTVGIDGIRILSVLGGFPALFLVIIAAVGLVKMLLNGHLY